VGSFAAEDFPRNRFCFLLLEQKEYRHMDFGEFLSRVPAWTGRKPLQVGVPLLFLAACAPTDPGQPALSGTDAAIASATANSETAATETTSLPEQRASLIGSVTSELEKKWGRPARIRVENPARIYQYVGTECVLDIYLYADRHGYRVFYVEARDALARNLPIDRCVESLDAARVASIEN
jgi:hypothetical protein